MSVSVCLRVCVSVGLRAYLQNYMSDLHQLFVHITYSRGSVLLWLRCDMLCTSGFLLWMPSFVHIMAKTMRRKKEYTQIGSTEGQHGFNSVVYSQSDPPWAAPDGQ